MLLHDLASYKVTINNLIVWCSACLPIEWQFLLIALISKINQMHFLLYNYPNAFGILHNFCIMRNWYPLLRASTPPFLSMARDKLPSTFLTYNSNDNNYFKSQLHIYFSNNYLRIYSSWSNQKTFLHLLFITKF